MSKNRQKSPSRRFIAVLIIIFLGGVIGFVTLIFTKANGSMVTIGESTYRVQLAATDQERALGLGASPGMQKDSGMLFVFDQVGRHCFWMKDMKFPIDIIWLDESKKVVHVKENATPDSYPARSFCPSQDASYVLEVNTGEVRKHRITIGEQATFKL